MSARQKGRQRSAQELANLRQGQRERIDRQGQHPNSLAALEKGRATPWTEERRQRARERWLGRVFSEASREKMRQSALKRWDRWYGDFEYRGGVLVVAK